MNYFLRNSIDADELAEKIKSEISDQLTELNLYLADRVLNSDNNFAKVSFSKTAAGYTKLNLNIRTSGKALIKLLLDGLLLTSFEVSSNSFEFCALSKTVFIKEGQHTFTVQAINAAYDLTVNSAHFLLVGAGLKSDFTPYVHYSPIGTYRFLTKKEEGYFLNSYDLLPSLTKKLTFAESVQKCKMYYINGTLYLLYQTGGLWKLSKETLSGVINEGFPLFYASDCTITPINSSSAYVFYLFDGGVYCSLLSNMAVNPTLSQTQGVSLTCQRINKIEMFSETEYYTLIFSTATKTVICRSLKGQPLIFTILTELKTHNVQSAAIQNGNVIIADLVKGVLNQIKIPLTTFIPVKTEMCYCDCAFLTQDSCGIVYREGKYILI